MADEPLTRPDFYGEDRVFVYLRDADQPDAGLDGTIDDLRGAGHPVVTLDRGARRPGPDLFLSEFATAVAGWVLDINAVRPAQRAGGQGQHQQGAGGRRAAAGGGG